MFKNRSVKISVVKDMEAPAPVKALAKFDVDNIKHVVVYSAVCIGVTAASIILTNAAADIAVNRLSK